MTTTPMMMLKCFNNVIMSQAGYFYGSQINSPWASYSARNVRKWSFWRLCSELRSSGL